jgi:hypothetical protein
MKPRRDTWLAAGLILALVLVTVLLSLQRSREAELPAYDSQSNQPNGALALRLWLEAQKFTVLPALLKTDTFAPPAAAHLLFVLEPGPLSDDELKQLDEWVKDGNTLVAAGNGIGSLALARHYEFQPRFQAEIFSKVTLAAPLLIDPPLSLPLALQTDTSFNPTRSDFVPYLVAADAPLMVSFALGRGKVILLSAARPFSNEGLKETGSPELILNILALSLTRGPVWFDEWHHGLRGVQTEIIGPENWLRYTPTGRALLFIVLVVFLGLIFQGRVFGRPVPVRREMRRRAPLEYITAIANLSRRAGHRRDVLAQYHASLKRGLGRRYRLDPTLADELYVAQLGKYDPRLDQSALLALLTRLNASAPSEAELLKLAAETAAWLKDLPVNP